jgi:hypothetical protein
VVNNQLSAQDIAAHQWQHRLIFVHTDDPDSDIFQEQLREFAKDTDGLQERKLEIYQFHAGAYRKGWQADADWTKSELDLRNYFTEKNSFELVLIGLDGGVKMRQHEVLRLPELFAIIDGMPMRRAEMRRKGEE